MRIAAFRIPLFTAHLVPDRIKGFDLNLSARMGWNRTHLGLEAGCRRLGYCYRFSSETKEMGHIFFIIYILVMS